MRRQNPVSVKVIAPSRGIISRWPGETADGLATGADKFSAPGLKNRASAFGSNVRYDDGVVRMAPGYDRIVLTASILTDLLAHWRLNELTGTRFEATLNHYDLSEVLGPDQIIGVGQIPGKFQQAALFTTVAPAPTFDVSLLNNNYILDSYSDGDFTNALETVSILPAWDGGFRGVLNIAPTAFGNTMFGYGWTVNGTFQCGFSAAGRRLVNAAIDWHGVIDESNQSWELMIGDNGTRAWQGTKNTGLTPEGVYTKNFGSSAGPATLTVVLTTGTPDSYGVVPGTNTPYFIAST